MVPRSCNGHTMAIDRTDYGTLQLGLTKCKNDSNSILTVLGQRLWLRGLTKKAVTELWAQKVLEAILARVDFEGVRTRVKLNRGLRHARPSQACRSH